jgi:DNA mismatch repair protein MutS2
MLEKTLKTLEYYKIINQLTSHATTPLGKQKCEDLKPMTDINEINQALQETTDAANRIRLKGSLSLSGARDIRASLKRLEIGSNLGIGELLSIQVLLTATARAKNYGRSTEDIEEGNRDTLTPFFDSLQPLTPLNKEIERCIVSEDEVSDDASSGLRQVRRSMSTINGRIHAQLNSLLNSHRTQLQDGVITIRNGRYCLPVRAEYKGQFQGMVHDQSATGSTYFIEPMAVIKLNNELRELEIKEQKEIEIILANLSSEVAQYTEELKINLEALSQLDFIFAKAMLSKDYRGTSPIFNTKGYLSIKDGRHPLLDPKKVVPTTIYLGDDFNLLIITGPNTGGKTVSLKTTGLLTLMGQAGLHIPAFEGSELAVFQQIYVDIGDEQSIEQSLSTFSAHMTNIAPILQQADEDSLVLFDELGAGTDPVEGAALAMSILSFLHNLRVRTMATTHYSELKVFALSTPGVENASCEFDVETLSPTYRLLIGIPGKSNAFAISKKLGIEDHIIETARSYIGKQEKDFEDVISELEASKATLEAEQAEVTKYREEAKKLKEQLNKQKAELAKSKERILIKANEEARQILQDAKETADQSIRRINKLGIQGGLTKDLETERTKIREKLNETDKRATKVRVPHKKHKANEFKIGDSVRVIPLNVKGTVDTLPNAKGNLYVQMGIMRSQFNIKDLELLAESTISGPDGKIESYAKGSSSKIKMSKSLSVSTEVNLIGMTTDEAVSVLDKYLDDAYLAHLPQVRVVHGRGTGALKNAVHNQLKRLSYVKDFRLGTFGEGNTGVTIVTFDTAKN